MNSFRALIADDERLMREQLRARLAEVWPELSVVGEARNGAEALEFYREQRPEVVFLDIRMPGMGGIEAAREIVRLSALEEQKGSPGCEVVFVTAYDQYAIEAFEQGIVDYVLKPAESTRLARTAARLRQRLAGRSAAGAAGRESHTRELLALVERMASKLEPTGVPRLKWIQASLGTGIQMIEVETVLFFVADEKYTRLRTSQGEALIRKPIRELVQELDPEIFWQVHRGTIVNVRAIQSVSRSFGGRLLIGFATTEEKLEVSRSFASRFKSM